MEGDDTGGEQLGMLAWLLAWSNFDEFVVIGMGLVLVAPIVKAGCGPAMADS